MLGNKEILSKNLNNFIDNSGKTKPQIAKDLNVPLTTFYDWCNGVTYPRIDNLQSLADYFGVFKSDLSEDKKNVYGNHNDNLEYLSNKPELLVLYKQIYESESLQLLFDSAKDLSPEDLESVLIHIQGIRKARGLD